MRAQIYLRTLYETKKIVKELRLSYNKIHECPNDCMIYWGEIARETSCSIRKASRYKVVKQHSDDERTDMRKLTQLGKTREFLPWFFLIFC